MLKRKKKRIRKKRKVGYLRSVRFDTRDIMHRRSIDYSDDAIADRVTKTLTLEKRICRLENRRLEVGMLSAGRSNDCQIFENKAINFYRIRSRLPRRKRKKKEGGKEDYDRRSLPCKEREGKRDTSGLIKSSGISLSMRARRASFIS